MIKKEKMATREQEKKKKRRQGKREKYTIIF